MTVNILVGDVRARLAELPDESVHCVVTSPPYFGLRDYGINGQIGLEDTPAAFVAVMVEVFREVRRVLRKDGTLWLNLGESYSSGGRTTQVAPTLRGNGKDEASGKQAYLNNFAGRPGNIAGLKPKDLIGIPWRVAFALQADGWYLRQDIIWSKPNPMPESVTDRCTKSHEYLFLLSKGPRYHYDAEAISEPLTQSSIDRLNQPTLEQQEGSWRVPGKTNGAMKAKRRKPQGWNTSANYHNADPRYKPREESEDYIAPVEKDRRNRRSVWTVATQPFSEAHFATFPPALIEPCIKAGCPQDCCAKCGAAVVREVEKSRTFESGSGKAGNMPVGKNGANLQGGGATLDIRRGPVVHVETTGWSPSCSCDAGLTRGTVLDPFGGAGTTGLVADRLGRNALLIELNPEYAALAERRIKGDCPLFADVVPTQAAAPSL